MAGIVTKRGCTRAIWVVLMVVATAGADPVPLQTPFNAPSTTNSSATAPVCEPCGNQPAGTATPSRASRRWRGGRCDDSARTRRKILISTQILGQIRRQSVLRAELSRWIRYVSAHRVLRLHYALLLRPVLSWAPLQQRPAPLVSRASRGVRAACRRETSSDSAGNRRAPEPP